MIKFFRKIRQNLSSENKTGKYLKYAIGEILLVVLGILIAVEINDWNTQRISGMQEQQILEQLKEEYLDNREQLESKINVRNTMISASFELLDDKNSRLYENNIDSFNLLLFETMFRPTFDPALGVTNELINSGKLYLIKNHELRKSISDWSGKYYNELEEEEQLVFDYVRNQYYPFIVEHYSLRNVMAQMKNSALWQYVHFADAKEAITSSLKLQNDDVDDATQLMTKDNFVDHLVTIISWNESANNQSAGVMRKMNEILVMIDEAIIK